MKTFKEFIKGNKPSQEEYLVEEYLEEMSTVFRDRESNQICQVNPDRSRRGLEYFKLYNSDSYDTADSIARISFREPKYIIHKNTDGRLNWVLNSKQKKALVKALNLPSKKYKGYNNYQTAILDFNNEKGLDIDQTKENFVNDLKYPDYLPIDLSMPDYMKL